MKIDLLDVMLLLLIFAVGALVTLNVMDNNKVQHKLDKVLDENQDIRNAIIGIEARRDYNDTLKSTTVAQYRPDSQTIQLFTLKDNNLTQTEMNFYHELGHKVWYQYLTKEDRTQYEFLFNTTNSFVSDYSRTSLLESFAEDYSYYRMNLSINKEKELIMEKYK